MAPETPNNRPKSKIEELFDGLSAALQEIFNKIVEIFGYKTENLSEEQADRLSLIADIEGNRISSGGLGIFNETTNPLRESGDPAVNNILSFPVGIRLDPFVRNNETQNNSWVRHNGEPHWRDHKGYLIPKPQVAFLIRDGYNPETDGTIEEFMDSKCKPNETVKFLNYVIEGGVHPVLLARLRQVEQAMEAQGIYYSTDGKNTITRISGYDYRTMGHDVISLHAFGLAIDFSKNDENEMIHLPNDRDTLLNSDQIDQYLAECDYSREFYDLMDDLGFRVFGEWVANGRHERDTMQFDLKPGANGTIPYDFDEEIHMSA